METLPHRQSHSSASVPQLLPAWARIADGLTLLLAIAAFRVAFFGAIRIGAIFSMSTPWRALIGLTIICALRHYLVRVLPLHDRVWNRLRSAFWTLRHLAIRSSRSRPLRLVLRCAHWSLNACRRAPRSTAARAMRILAVTTLTLQHLPTRCRQSRPVRLALRCARWSLSAYERATHMTLARGLQILALTAFAVAQPLFDVISREPAFLVARNTTSDQLFLLVVIIAVALPLLFVAVEAVFARLHPVAGTVVHLVLLTLLGSLLFLPVLQRLHPMGTLPLLAVTLLLAAGTALSSRRSRVVHMFLTALSPAAVVVPAVFLANPNIRGALIGPDDTPIPAAIEYAPPIIFVVFDEFPTVSLLNSKREINRDRYPNFARLTDDATWFRNASTVSSQTVWAVPAIVTGRYPLEPYSVPTRRYYPHNLFSILSEKYQMTVFGRFLQLCPANACAYDLEVRDTLLALTTDLAVVYLHVVAPSALAAQLPPIVDDWRGFARRRLSREVDGERSPNARAPELDRFLQTITSESTGRFYFLHTLTPHMPFEYVPSGARYFARWESTAGLFLKSDPWFPIVLQQRHLLQVGFADRFIGQLIDRLQEKGIYDESLVVVTADHGARFTHGMPRRTIAEQDPADIVLVPLIVKFPGLKTGTISDEGVETIDIVPTIADVLSATIPYEIHGQSLLDPSRIEKPHKTFVQRNLERVSIARHPKQFSDDSLVQKLQHFEQGLYGLGPHGLLVGCGLPELDGILRRGSRLSVENAWRFNDVDVQAEVLPLNVRGTFNNDVARRVSVGIGVNGVLVATTVSYLQDGRWVFASMIPEGALVAGANKVEAFVLGNASDDYHGRPSAQAASGRPCGGGAPLRNR